MKKILTAFLIGVSGFSYAQQSLNSPNAKEGGFSGSVKSVLQKRVMIDSDSSRRDVPESYTEYTKEGNKSLYRSLTNSPKIFQRISTYDASKKLIEVKEYQDTLLVGRTLYEYDSQSRKTKETVFAQNGMQREKTLYSYDQAGNLVEEQLFGFGDLFVLKKTYEYDKKGNRLSMRSYNEKNVLTYEYLYQYDERNNKTEQQYRKSSGSVQTTKYVYNEKNKLTKLSQYSNDQLISETEYMYDQNGVNTETVQRNPQSESKTVSRNNEKGLTTETLEYKNDEVVVRQTWRYDYDAAGNWIRSYNSYNGQSPTITERAFQYY